MKQTKLHRQIVKTLRGQYNELRNSLRRDEAFLNNYRIVHKILQLDDAEFAGIFRGPVEDCDKWLTLLECRSTEDIKRLIEDKEYNIRMLNNRLHSISFMLLCLEHRDNEQI